MGESRTKECIGSLGRDPREEITELRLEITTLRVLAQHWGPEKGSVSLLRATGSQGSPSEVQRNCFPRVLYSKKPACPSLSGQVITGR